jgi:hypothetical protein
VRSQFEPNRRRKKRGTLKHGFKLQHWQSTAQHAAQHRAELAPEVEPEGHLLEPLFLEFLASVIL